MEVSIPDPWFGPSRPIHLDVTINNASSQTLGDLRATLSVYRRARSRSDLAKTLAGDLPRSALVATSYRLDDVAPGSEISLPIDEDLASRPAFDQAPDGVYPMTLSIGKAGETPIVRAVSAVVFLSEPVVTPLSILPIVTIVPPPILRANGSAPARISEQLETIAGRLSALGPQNVLAISPLMTDELLTLRSAKQAASRLLDQLRVAARDHGVATVPYTNVRLPDTADLPVTALDELTAGRATLKANLDSTTLAMVVPPGLATDDSTLAAIKQSGAKSVVVSSRTFSDLSGLTPGEVTMSDGLLTLPADVALGTAISEARSALDVSRAIAAAAMIFFESPGRSRTVPYVANGLSPKTAVVTEQLSRMPWVSLQRPEAVQATTANSLTMKPLSLGRPPASFRRQADAARAAVARFESYTLDDNPLLAPLRLAIHGTYGTAWWDQDWSEGVKRARAISTTVGDQQSLIRTRTTGPITFTSRSGEIPIAISNSASYPIRLRVDVTSSKLRFPDGNRRLVERIDPPGGPMTFAAVAEATGTFTMRVTLRSPDGRVVVDETEVLVRSTAANVLAVALTVGGALFVVGWYGLRLGRKKKP